MSERPSVDSAAVRREVRRRKILENSEKRLKSITGRPVSEPGEARQESRNRFLYDFQDPHVNDAFGEPGESSSPELDAEENIPTDKHADGDQDDDDDPLINPDVDPIKLGTARIKTLLRRRFHLVILSLFIQVLYSFKLGYLYFNNIYCPFIIAKLMEIWMVSDPFRMENEEQLLLMSTMFDGPRQIFMLKAYYVFASVASDFCLYIFVIVASDKLFQMTIASYFGLERENASM